MTVVSIHQPQYLSYLGFFHKIYHSDIFIALDDAQFQKNGLQNRNKIKTAQGWQWLTVPVQHRLGQLINEVQIDGRTPWSRKHWQALVASYARAPYFDAYATAIKELLEYEYQNLSQVNMTLTRWVLAVLAIERPIYLSSTLNIPGNQTTRLVHLCQAVGGDCYLSGPGGHAYMDLDLFTQANIRIRWQQFTPPVYEQRFPQVGFIPNLSILDVLFNCGPDTIRFLE